jgi:hypothetical protein
MNAQTIFYVLGSLAALTIIMHISTLSDQTRPDHQHVLVPTWWYRKWSPWYRHLPPHRRHPRNRLRPRLY